MNVFAFISILVTAVATGVIAWYANRSHNLASKIQSRDNEYRQQVTARDNEYRQQVTDLYQAIVISYLLQEMGWTTKEKIKVFNEHYTGKTRIFK